jgi:predicted kinase
MGVPGAGKSAVAARMAEVLGVEVVDRDAIRAAMFPGCAFTGVEKAAANAAVREAVAANCALGRACVVDGMTFARAADLAALRGCVADAGGTLLPILLDCPVHVARARVATQPHVAADRTPDLVDAVAARFETPPADAQTIAADRPLDEVCAAAIALVRAAARTD